MDVGDWISLLACVGALGSFVFFVRAALRDGNQGHPFQPVWLVLLTGGTASPDRPGDSEAGGDGHRSPWVPPREPTSGSPESERQQAALRKVAE